MRAPVKTSKRPAKTTPAADDRRPTTPRRLALDVLGRVFGDQRPFDEAFAGHSGLESLEQRDRAFARLLITTVLRRRGQIDEALDRYLKKAPDPKVRNILRLGAAQLMFLETPPHAAVGETVALAEGRASYAAGLANAVLRRLANELAGIEKRQDAARLSLPDWLWRSWTKAYGEEITRAIALAQLQEPPLDISIKGDAKTWSKALGGEVLGGSTVRLPAGGAGGPIDGLPGYGDGAWWIQDVAATLPARLLGPLAGRHVVDLCAAPGGKTAQLAAAGAKVTSIEASEKRAERLRENLARLQLEAEVIIADALEWRAPEPAVLALLDAPCTATGTIRRHPDIPHLKTKGNLKELVTLQARLLHKAVRLVKPGGLLVYCTCSLQPEEGEKQVAKLLAQDGSLQRVAITADDGLGLPDAITPDGDLRTLPSLDAGAPGGMDGFFACRIRR